MPAAFPILYIGPLSSNTTATTSKNFRSLHDIIYAGIRVLVDMYGEYMTKDTTNQQDESADDTALINANGTTIFRIWTTEQLSDNTMAVTEARDHGKGDFKVPDPLKEFLARAEKKGIRVTESFEMVNQDEIKREMNKEMDKMIEEEWEKN